MSLVYKSGHKSVDHKFKGNFEISLSFLQKYIIPIVDSISQTLQPEAIVTFLMVLLSQTPSHQLRTVHSQ